jgi:hypothetical protein
MATDGLYVGANTKRVGDGAGGKGKGGLWLDMDTRLGEGGKEGAKLRGGRKRKKKKPRQPQMSGKVCVHQFENVSLCTSLISRVFLVFTKKLWKY